MDSPDILKLEELILETKRLNTIINNLAEDLEVKAEYEQLQADLETAKNQRTIAEGTAKLTARINSELQAKNEKLMCLMENNHPTPFCDEGYLENDDTGEVYECEWCKALKEGGQNE